MRKLVLLIALIAASCGGGDAETTTSSQQTTTTAASTTTSSSTSSTSTSTSTSTTSSTTTTTIADGFIAYTNPLFELAYPETWSENPEFPGFGGGFIEDHSALALPPTTFDIFLEEQEPGFDLDANVDAIIADLGAFVPNFRVLDSGEGELDGVRTRWFEYADEINGFPVVIREEVALRDNLLVTTTLISPEEFFSFDRTQAAAVLDTFRFA